MIRKHIYSIEYVYNQLKTVDFNLKQTQFINFDNESIKGASQRYAVFMRDNCTCVKCGLKATYFALERFEDQKRYHLNLYGLKDNKEILFTKDHIITKTKSRKDKLDNYQTMCCICNELKADELEDI